MSFGNDLLAKDRVISRKVNKRISKKVYFRWFNAYFSRLEVSYRPYTDNLKKKVFRSLIHQKRHRWLNERHASRKHDNTLKFKGWFGLLSHLTSSKEDKNIAETARQRFRDKTYTDRAVVVKPVIDKILPGENYEGNLFFDQKSSID
jgi:hypothetical protein